MAIDAVAKKDFGPIAVYGKTPLCHDLCEHVVTSLWAQSHVWGHTE